jgi:hypothetical protein
VSHLKERKEKICLNCKADLYGLYCHVCGQANTEPKESVWHLVNHFFSDITHFDGKFFTTVKDLIAKPGFLSREYMIGKRASYLNPVRMYVFTSAFFFIIFFSLFNTDRLNIDQGKLSNTDSLMDLNKIRQEALKDSKDKEDSLTINKAFGNVQDSFLISNGSPNQKPLKVHTRLDSDMIRYRSVAEYDSIQNRLDPAKRDKWVYRAAKRKGIHLVTKYKHNVKGFLKELLNAFLHQLPKMLFISLPIFALLLKLLYVRRKAYYYTDHGIFSIHLYIYFFILLLFWFGVRELRHGLDWTWLSTLTLPLYLYSQYYFYRAMYIFYKQGWFKTFVKYLLLNFLSFFVFLFIFIFFIIFSVMEI